MTCIKKKTFKLFFFVCVSRTSSISRGISCPAFCPIILSFLSSTWCCYCEDLPFFLGLVQSTLALRRRLSFVSWYCCRLQIRFFLIAEWFAVVECHWPDNFSGTNLFGEQLPFRTVRELKTTFLSSRWRWTILPLKRIFWIYRCRPFVATAKEKSICLRREANPDRWIGRRTFSLCTSRPRHKALISAKQFNRYLVQIQQVSLRCQW